MSSPCWSPGRRMHFVVRPAQLPAGAQGPGQPDLPRDRPGDRHARVRLLLAAGRPRARRSSSAYYHDHLKNAALRPLTARMEERLRVAFDRFTGDDWREEGLFDFSARVIFAAGMETLFGEGIADDAALRDFQRTGSMVPAAGRGRPGGRVPRAAPRPRAPARPRRPACAPTPAPSSARATCCWRR